MMRAGVGLNTATGLLLSGEGHATISSVPVLRREKQNGEVDLVLLYTTFVQIQYSQGGEEQRLVRSNAVEQCE